MMANRFRHYERWPGAPAGFLAVGDAACAFNPVYGQGMTSAAVCATVLGETLRRHGPRAPGLAAHAFRAQAAFLRQVWDLATGADLRFETTEGERPSLLGPINRYMDALFEASNDDLVVRDVVTDVMHLLRAPTGCFAPGVAWRVARHALGRARRRAAGAAVGPDPWPAPVAPA
jgi:2-polyprenyl-6-methoxyphenol hydroxylase-like FAD-dependent oxidoreductase